jgi:hypothetical protein
VDWLRALREHAPVCVRARALSVSDVGFTVMMPPTALLFLEGNRVDRFIRSRDSGFTEIKAPDQRRGTARAHALRCAPPCRSRRIPTAAPPPARWGATPLIEDLIGEMP